MSTPASDCRLCATPIEGRTGAAEGFCCTGCQRVFEVLASLDNDAHAAYLETARRLGIIPGDPDSPQSPKQPGATLESALPGALREQRFQCGGLSCPSCSWIIEQVLTSSPGVRSARVDYFSGTGLVSFDMRNTSADALADVLAPLGYRLQPYTDGGGRLLSRPATFSFVVAAIITMNLMSLSVVRYFERLGMITDVPEVVPWLEFILALPVLVIGWVPMVRRAFQGLRRRQITMDFLIAIGVLAAFVLSTAALLTGRPDIYFETCAGLVTIALLSRMIEARLRARAFSDLSGLLRTRVVHARLVETDGSETYLGVDQIQFGDRVRVEKGETLPFDGEVVGPDVWLSEAVLTGEPMPLRKTLGDPVTAGSEVSEGTLDLQVTHRYEETRLARIATSVARTLERAETRLRSADRISAVFAPLVLLVALLTWLARMGLYGMPYALSADGWFPSVAILAVACPCAFSLAGISALTAATGALLKNGVLVKEPVQLDELPRIDHLVFDKTGTLTEGRMVVEGIEWRGDAEPQALELCAQAEFGVAHPVAEAIRHHLGDALADSSSPFTAQDHAGRGRSVEWNERIFYVGSAALFQETFTPRSMNETHTVVWFGFDKRAVGCFLISDRVRPEAADAISALRAQGLTAELVSGDRSEVADFLGKELGLSQTAGGVTLEQKVELVQERTDAGHRVAFVGDGTNDALAMGASDASVALARSTDEALTAAGFVALRGNLEALPYLFETARRLRRVVRGNYIWAFAFNVLFIPVAAAGRLVPLAAMALMLVSSSAVLLNSLRMRHKAG